jgi:hypothetical protein
LFFYYRYFLLIEYYSIESKLQLSPRGGAKQNPIRKCLVILIYICRNTTLKNWLCQITFCSLVGDYAKHRLQIRAIGIGKPFLFIKMVIIINKKPPLDDLFLELTYSYSVLITIFFNIFISNF